jgi:hypothetical protein
VSQTLTTASPCTAPAPVRPRVVIGSVPKGCAPRSFVARVRVEDLGPLRFARARLDGRTVHSSTKPRFRVRVTPGRGAGRHRLSVVAVDREGRTRSAAAAFRAC